MNNVSFGKLDFLLKDGNKPVIEHLIFEKEGRGHKHPYYEIFVTLKGSGKVFVGDKEFDATVGSIVVIPPKTSHWMVPEGDNPLEGFLWYQDEEPSYLL